MPKKSKTAVVEPPAAPTPPKPLKEQNLVTLRVPFSQLHPGPNARDPKTYSRKGLEELADTILEHGLLHSLIGRQVRPGVYEFTEGGRRYAALGILIERGSITPDFEVSLQLRDLTDAGAIALGIVANTMREQMTPLQEADAFARALEGGLSHEDIAVESGKSLTAIRKRVELATRLSPEARGMLEEGQISLGQAQALTVMPIERQGQFLKSAKSWDNWDARTVQRNIVGQALPVSNARFTQEQARAAGLVATEDLFGNFEPYYADGVTARQLQLEAAQAQLERLKKKWVSAHLVELVGGEYASNKAEALGLEYYGQRTKDKALGHALVVVEKDLSIEVVEGLLPRKSVKANSVGKKLEAEPKPITHLTQGAALAAKTAKVQTLQLMALGLDDRKLLELVAYALLGVQGIAVDTSRAYGSLDVHPTLQERSKALKGFGRGEGGHYQGQPGFDDPYRQSQAKVFEQIAALTDGELRDLVRLELAYALGGRNEGNHDVNSPRLREWAPALAGHWGAEGEQLEVRRAVITADWLKGLTTPRLQQIHNELRGGSTRENLTKKELVQVIISCLPGNPTWLPEELKFAQAIQPNAEEETLHQAMLKRSTNLILEDGSDLYLNVEGEMLVIRNETEIVVSLTSGDAASLASNLRERAAETTEEWPIQWGHEPPLYEDDALSLAETLEELLEELEDNELEEDGGDDE